MIENADTQLRSLLHFSSLDLCNYLKPLLFDPYQQRYIDTTSGEKNLLSLEYALKENHLGMLDDVTVLAALKLFSMEKSIPLKVEVSKEDLHARVSAFMHYVEEAEVRYRQANQYLNYVKMEFSESDQWIKIYKNEFSSQSQKFLRQAIFCFIAVKDGFTRQLGYFKAGDIFEPASFKAPAKNARGNVFLEDFGDPIDEHASIRYLR